ncbi:MAG: D-alanyl-D-alaninecarboxypeptidase/D-alanyl-D-alanine-endopeptidase [Ferruginibacter sp.]|uniref:D-alanyl-D-alanine carboxypeptidase/D-alanyl-D-alanine endopeptidase n=1 Tax=Ferruginibacter sp. TaxID=1940288 RepID=UPI002659061D|nr:D-alanyl-D-alanine carboxypeptidase/D-alanyl-D-alanine-endopeptidase [Ferruginibacter sp.]MDB5279300.1 D-alanyl-D-alaninecarboxypeptidase/D-alanyl-D-alanine-endopeptidase [Ferruginibacter sp.]
MKKGWLFIYCLLPFVLPAQNISIQLAAGIKNLQGDEQFKHAVIAMYVVDAKTGKLIFDNNAQIGLAPASCQKVITSVTAFELLGHDYRYKTYLTRNKPITDGALQGDLYIAGGGDPTLGSSRWTGTSEDGVIKKITAVLQKNNIQSIAGSLVADDHLFATDAVPRGWVWEDIGNYYGAGAWGLNWRENQFDVSFKTGAKESDSTNIIATVPPCVLTMYQFSNFITTGARGSGDNGYLFSAPFAKNIIAKGTVPPSANGFTISGSLPNPPAVFLKVLADGLRAGGIAVGGNNETYSERLIANRPLDISTGLPMDSILSPPLDSINHWFLKKSVNLFGEVLVKTIAVSKSENVSTEDGIKIIKDFWSKKGIETSAINILDGSGLSPASRVTTQALVTVMQFARQQKWFTSFYNALPEANGIRMKDGYISGVRSYTGYIKSSNGREYTFAFIVNNFDGNPGTVREKIWKLLDMMK